MAAPTEVNTAAAKVSKVFLCHKKICWDSVVAKSNPSLQIWRTVLWEVRLSDQPWKRFTSMLEWINLLCSLLSGTFCLSSCVGSFVRSQWEKWKVCVIFCPKSSIFPTHFLNYVHPLSSNPDSIMRRLCSHPSRFWRTITGTSVFTRFFSSNHSLFPLFSSVC